MLAFELDQAAGKMQLLGQYAGQEPVEDDYSEESFPEEDRNGDLAWRCQEMLAAGQLLRDARRWAKRPHREPECLP
jgi:hypothetical protein